ncbi:MAG: cardiolipin synthase [Myxococcales bacterium]|nr:cardiolipin synthase [Myxococcales bacterium]
MSEILPIVIAGLALDAYAIGRALLRHHGVSTTLFWILAIVFVPFVGALFYLTAASPYLPRRKATRRRKAIRGAGLGPQGGEPPPDPTGLFALCARLTELTPTTGNHLKFLGEGQQAFAALEAGLAAAQASIWAEYYIIKNDETGGRFLDLLIARARAGVQVYLLFDAVGSLGLDGRRLKALRAAGGHAEAFLPVNPLRRRWSVHLRNHRKVVVIDGQLALTGGMNVGDEYSGRGRRHGGPHFRDAFVQVEGPAVYDLAQVFAEDWAYATDQVLPLPEQAEPLPGGSTLAVVASGPDQRQNAHALAWFTAISTARQRIWLTSPYFVPDQPTSRALIAAALRGVDVRVLLPSMPHMDVKLVGWASRGYFAPLLAAGVRVFEYGPSMLHAKTFVGDDALGFVGSANVDLRSMGLNFEVSTVVTDAAFVHTLAERFLVDQGVSTELTLAAVRAVSVPRRLLYGAARLWSPLL